MWVRSATKEDLNAVRDMLVETWHATYDDVYGVEKVNAITDRYHSLDALKKQLAKPYSEFIIADDGADILGMAYASQKDHKLSILNQLYVHPEHQKQGVGSLLLAEVESAFPGVFALQLEVIEQNQNAIRFYESRGFERTNGRIDNWGEPNSGISAVVLEKSLTGYELAP
ncbi:MULTISPECIES: GNAT family N-acetyltransferase [Phyllobacterium]|jgi:ribosomal protein S18 acetylase RimI-like enzyme|uniref:GNAT family N-acetyltransferase n=1 Tax=Phyllobacterium sophorae TaxID=1520277 RepID=A0A2P7BIK6_9HYPH|nr:MULTISPECIES: GNAT family N-acetyltransferase [Phyllobacterium]PSH66299.1 GNAT family N-acetyltransferase [Phyllobacterium sophorae]UXN64136.1 GNAT family N-acetyltransferase [Phyllobacterium sp. A18/5-2]